MFCIFFDSNLLLKSFISVCLCVGVMAGFGTAAATAKVKNKIKKYFIAWELFIAMIMIMIIMVPEKKQTKLNCLKKWSFLFFSQVLCVLVSFFSISFAHFFLKYQKKKKLEMEIFFLWQIFFWGEISRKFPIGNIHLYSHTISEFLKCFLTSEKKI